MAGLSTASDAQLASATSLYRPSSAVTVFGEWRRHRSRYCREVTTSSRFRPSNTWKSKKVFQLNMVITRVYKIHFNDCLPSIVYTAAWTVGL